MATHYEVLGVPPDATASELRAAYVAKARSLHPDRHAGAGAAERRRAERAMQDVNAAWTVLSDPRARREYDASLHRRDEPAARPAPAGPRRPTSPPPVVLPDFEPAYGAGLPMLVRVAPVVFLMGILGVIFVFTAFAAGGGSDDAPSETTIEVGTPTVGSCVAIVPPVIEVSCRNPHALRVERLAPAGDDCSGGTVPLAWGDDTTLCVRPPS